jgi:DNA modification methylase
MAKKQADKQSAVKEQEQQLAKIGDFRDETRSVASLIPYARNSRKHSDESTAIIMGSIKEFGFTNRVLIDEEGVIIAGHNRTLAAQRLGMTEIPCRVAIGWTETQKKAYVILDNQSAIHEGTTWDIDLLQGELVDLTNLGFEMPSLGFSEDQLKDLLEPLPNAGAGGATEDDAIPSVPAESISKPGDVWICGKHRVMAGDALWLANVERLMHGEMAKCIFTDPPYGVDFERGKFQGNNNGKKFDLIANDELKGSDLTEFIREALGNAFMVSNEPSLYVWAPSLRQGADILDGILAAGFHILSQIIWHKTPFVLGRGDYHWAHENCWYGRKDGEGHSWYGERNKQTVWEVPKPQVSDLHPTMKPVKLAEIALENSTKAGDIVLDLFAGSGSTLIACEKLSRRGFVMELSTGYVDVICTRWMEYTEQEPVNEATGLTFSETAANANLKVSFTGKRR